MISIKAKGAFTDALLHNPTVDVESIMSKTIAETIAKDIAENLEDLPFIDSVPSEAGFSWEANIVICSQAQVDTSIRMMVQRLKESGISDKTIEYCLEPAITDLGGF